MDEINKAILQAMQAAARLELKNSSLPTTRTATKSKSLESQKNNSALVSNNNVQNSSNCLMSIADVFTGTQVVDGYFNVNENGLQIGAFKGLVEEIRVRIDMSEIMYSEAVKFGQPAQYDKTYDRIMAASGKSWPQALADAKRVDPKARLYPSADISMTLVEEVKLKDKKIEAGFVVGHSLSTTGFESFAKLVTELGKKGIDPASATIDVWVGCAFGELGFQNPVEVFP